MTRSVGNLPWREWRRRKRELREWRRGGPLPPVFREAEDRMRLIRVEAERLADADVAPSLALTREQVSREAARVTAALDERARMNGYAQTEIATEDDDWLKLDLYLELEGASSVAALPPEAANEWARRMAAHERLRLASGGSIEER